MQKEKSTYIENNWGRKLAECTYLFYSIYWY